MELKNAWGKVWHDIHVLICITCGILILCYLPKILSYDNIALILPSLTQASQIYSL